MAAAAIKNAQLPETRGVIVEGTAGVTAATATTQYIYKKKSRILSSSDARVSWLAGWLAVGNGLNVILNHSRG